MGASPLAVVQPARRIRVLVVDDSAVARKMLADALSQAQDIEVVGGARDPYVARDLILRHRPDAITLDMEMPRMDGLTFLRRLMTHHPLPVIVISSRTRTGSVASIEALRAGAVDVLEKPDSPRAMGQLAERLIMRLRAIAGEPRIQFARPPADAAPPARPFARGADGLIAIGASTGGPGALETLLLRVPADLPPTLVVQHMPASFTRAFADRLDSVCPMRVIEAEGGEVLERGTVYVAPGDRHLLVERHGLRLETRLSSGPPLHHQRPAVDALFHSAARLRGVPTVALLLTGMGADGADGMVALREAGAETIAEDEASCVVFGMPKEAIARGGAMHVADLLRMPDLIVDGLARAAKRDGARRADRPSISPPRADTSSRR